MNKTDLISKIDSMEIGEDRKKKIMDLINNNELNDDIISEVKAIIQEDIDQDINDILDEEDKKTLMDMDKEADDEIDTVIKGMDEDSTFVENEMNDLVDYLNSLTPTLEAINIEEVKSNLESNTK
jgi:hypothetical protein